VLRKSAASPALENNGLMKKSSCSVLQCSVPCSPEPGASGSVSYVCHMHPAILSWLPFPSVQLSVEALSACCGQCLVPGWGGDTVLTKCTPICLQNETCCCRDQGYVGGEYSFNKVCLRLLQAPPLPPLQCPRPHRIYGLGDMMLARFVLVLWGRGPVVPGLREV